MFFWNKEPSLVFTQQNAVHVTYVTFKFAYYFPGIQNCISAKWYTVFQSQEMPNHWPYLLKQENLLTATYSKDLADTCWTISKMYS